MSRSDRALPSDPQPSGALHSESQPSESKLSGLALVFGLAGLMTGVLGAYFGFDANLAVDELRLGLKDTAEFDSEALGTLAEDVKNLRRDVQEANKRLSAQAKDREDDLNRMRDIVRRLMILEDVEVVDGAIKMPGGSPVGTVTPLADVAYERLRAEVLNSETDDQIQYLFLLVCKSRGKLEALEKELVGRLETNPGRKRHQSLLEKARKLLQARPQDG